MVRPHSVTQLRKRDRSRSLIIPTPQCSNVFCFNLLCFETYFDTPLKTKNTNLIFRHRSAFNKGAILSINEENSIRFPGLGDYQEGKLILRFFAPVTITSFLFRTKEITKKSSGPPLPTLIKLRYIPNFDLDSRLSALAFDFTIDDNSKKILQKSTNNSVCSVRLPPVVNILIY